MMGGEEAKEVQGLSVKRPLQRSRARQECGGDFCLFTQPLSPLVPQPLRRHCRNRGAIMVVTLLALVLLASTVFYVFNVGQHLTQRIETQNAADATAVASAGAIARGFNTVAMNNVEAARLLALVNVLDAVPQAVAYTHEDQQAVLKALDRQLVAGVGPDAYVHEGLVLARDTVSRQVDMLAEVDVALNGSGYDVAAMTHFAAPDGSRGKLWEAIVGLGELSEATLSQLAVVVQSHAHTAARVNQMGDSASGGFALPLLAGDAMAVEQNDFEAFRGPVVDGLLPLEQDDKITNRGPFDVLFGWRIPVFDTTLRDRPVTLTQGFSLDTGVPTPPLTETESRTVTGYATWGTYRYIRGAAMRLGVGEGPSTGQYYPGALTFDPERPLVPSLWRRRIQFISDRKINALFPGTAPANVVRDPEWVTDFDTAAAIAQAGTPSVAYTLYVNFIYERRDVGGVQGTPELEGWGLSRLPGYRSLPPSARQVPYLWKDERIETSEDDQGVQTQAHQFLYAVFVGINVGQEVAVRNPNNFIGSERAALPGPVNFVKDEAPQRGDAALQVLGVAHRPKRAALWARAFDGTRPDADSVAVAQAHVFNNHSWDLWTQMWHAQLQPVEDLDDWARSLDDRPPSGSFPWLIEGDLNRVGDYLKAVAPWAPELLEH